MSEAEIYTCGIAKIWSARKGHKPKNLTKMEEIYYCYLIIAWALNPFTMKIINVGGDWCFILFY